MVCVMGRLMYWLSKIESPETSYCGQFRRHTVRWPKRPRPRAAFAAPLARTLAASDELQLGRKPLKSSHRWAGARPVRRTQKAAPQVRDHPAIIHLATARFYRRG